MYVEFIFAFIPLFIFFLALCQLSLLSAAQLVVQHAAMAGVRSAVVVLDDDPKHYDNAARGSLHAGDPTAAPNLGRTLASLGLPASLVHTTGSAEQQPEGGEALQRGARMGPIRAAATLPLMALSGAGRRQPTVAGGLATGFGRQLRQSVAYVRAASVVTVHDLPGSDEPASGLVPPDAPVTVRVTYLYQCSIPVVRRLLCQPSVALAFDGVAPRSGTGRFPALAKRFSHAETPGALRDLVAEDARFYVLNGAATLPNQGAKYYSREGG